MAWQLADEIRHHFPYSFGLTLAERAVLRAIADEIHQDDFRRGRRRTDRMHEELAEAAGMSKDNLAKTLQRLEKPNKRRPAVEVRVPIGKDKNGRRLFAVRGRKPTFELPKQPPPDGCPCATCNPKPGQGSGHRSQEPK